jgi:hypothetical protein
MTSIFITNIMNSVEQNINEFIKTVSIKHGIDEDELRNVWDGNNSYVNDTTVVPKKDKVVIEKKCVSEGSLCKYLLVRGPKKGTLCGCSIRQADKEFCSKHSIKKATTSVRKTPVIPDTDTKTITKILRRNKSIDKLWHEETGMVFYSNDDKTVVNRLVDGELKELTDEDIMICKEIGFAYREPVFTPMIEDEVAPMIEDEDTPMIDDEVNRDTINEVEDLLHSLQISNKDDMSEEEEEELLEEEE